MKSPDKSESPPKTAALSNHHSRRWLPYAGAAVLAVLIVAGLWPQPVPVETAQVLAGPLRVTVNEEGKTRIRQRYTVSAPVTGQLRRIPFKAGAEVQAGQTVLAVIDPIAPTPLDVRARSLAEAARDASAANLEKARASADFAASELRRFVRLYAEKTISIQEFEGAKLRDASAAKEVAAAESALRQAEAQLAESDVGNDPETNAACALREVKAPVSGRVLRVFEESARVVTAGAPLMEIGDPANLEVVVEVLSRDGAAMAPGARVEMEQWGGAGQSNLVGRVRLVEPAAFTKVSALGVEEQRVNVIVDLLTPPEHRSSVGDNFRVEARIVIWESAETLKVPAGALFRNGEQWAVFVVNEGHARLRPVTTGRSNGSETQILDGLKPGEQVVLYPGSRVHTGERVKPVTI
jgi:HlyD family secretion protein